MRIILSNNIEIIQIDRKYEGFRVQSPSREKILLGSIAEIGITDAICGVISKDKKKYILLDGFKRLRCAIKLGQTQILFTNIGEDEAEGILQLIRVSNNKSLTMLEQAKLVEELKEIFSLSVAEIALRLQRSKSWVVVRLQVLSEMSPKIMEEIIAGRFPLYSYIYSLRPHRRISESASNKDIENFVSKVSGHGFSTREIGLLSDGFFQGGSRMKQEIESGNLGWCINEMKQRADAKSSLPTNLNETEKRAIRDLEFMSQLVGRLPLRLTNRDLKSDTFFAEAVVITSGLINRWEEFTKAIRSFYDRCGVAECDKALKQSGNECATDELHFESKSKHN
jgi:hypothetical protein